MDTSTAAVDRRMGAFRERCAALGLALTPQRLAIYQVLAGNDGHPSAEAIFRQLKPAMPSLSLGTVYRTLEVFESHALVSRMHPFGDQALFEANLEPHHHLVCVRCRRVFDVRDERLQVFLAEEAEANGFQIIAHRVDLLGVCPECQGSEG